MKTITLWEKVPNTNQKQGNEKNKYTRGFKYQLSDPNIHHKKTKIQINNDFHNLQEIIPNQNYINTGIVFGGNFPQKIKNNVFHSPQKELIKENYNVKLPSTEMNNYNNKYFYFYKNMNNNMLNDLNNNNNIKNNNCDNNNNPNLNPNNVINSTNINNNLNNNFDNNNLNMNINNQNNFNQFNFNNNINKIKTIKIKPSNLFFQNNTNLNNNNFNNGFVINNNFNNNFNINIFVYINFEFKYYKRENNIKNNKNKLIF